MIVSPVLCTSQHPWLRSGRQTLPTRMGHYSTAHNFQHKESDVNYCYNWALDAVPNPTAAPWASHTWYTMQACVWSMLVGNRIVVSLTRSKIKPLLPFLKEQVNNVRMVVSRLWRSPGYIHGFILDGKILPTRIGYCSNTNCARRWFNARTTSLLSRAEGEVTRHSSWAMPLLALRLSNIIPTMHKCRHHCWRSAALLNDRFCTTCSGVKRVMGFMTSIK